MRTIRSCYWLESLLVSWIAISVSMSVLSHATFGQPASDCSIQGMPDLCTPQRHRLNGSWEIGGIWLSRQAPDSQDIVFDDFDNALLNADQLQGDMGGGLDTSLNLFNLFNHFSTRNALDFQLRYFQAGDMVANETVTGPSVVPVFFQGVSVNQTISSVVNYETRIRSFESNLVLRTPYPFQLLAGFRFFEVDETFNLYNQQSGAGDTIFQFRSRAENTMAGGQVGVEGTILSSGFSRVFGSC